MWAGHLRAYWCATRSGLNSEPRGPSPAIHSPQCVQTLSEHLPYLPYSRPFVHELS